MTKEVTDILVIKRLTTALVNERLSLPIPEEHAEEARELHRAFFEQRVPRAIRLLKYIEDAGLTVSVRA
jgi:hypothetical protein